MVVAARAGPQAGGGEALGGLSREPERPLVVVAELASGSGRPVRGGSRRARRARRAPCRGGRASRRSARAARPGCSWGAPRRPRRGQEVAEPEAVLGGQQGPSGRISSFRTSAVNRGATGVSGRPAPARRRGGRARPRPRPARARPAPSASSRSSRAASSAFSFGGTTTSSPAPAAIATISVTNSGLPPAALAIRSRRPAGDTAGRSSSTSAGGSGSSRSATGHCGRRSASSGRADADQEHRRARREQRDLLDEVEERLLAPLDVVEHDHERRRLLEQLAERPRDLVGRGRRVPLPEQRLRSPRRPPDRPAATSSCFTASTTGKYVIPSP